MLANADNQVQMLVDDMLFRLKESGIDAKVTYHLSRIGEIVSFEIKILGLID